MGSRTALNQVHQVGLPDPRGQPFACDVTQHQSKDTVQLQHLEKVAGQMAYRKDFAGDLKLAPYQLTRRAKPPLDLRRFVNGLLEFRVFTAHCFELEFPRSRSVRGGCGPTG